MKTAMLALALSITTLSHAQNLEPTYKVHKPHNHALRNRIIKGAILGGAAVTTIALSCSNNNNNGFHSLGIGHVNSIGPAMPAQGGLH